MKKVKNNANNKKRSITIICIIVAILGIIGCFVLKLSISKKDLSVIEYGDQKIKLNDIVENLKIDFSLAETTNMNDSMDYEMVPYDKVDTLKIKNRHSWSLEKNAISDGVYLDLIGFNREQEEISFGEGKIEYIRVYIEDGYYDINENPKVMGFGNLVLGKSDRHDVVKKITQIGNFDELVISDKLEEIYVKISDDFYALFKLNNDGVLIEVRLSTYYI